MSERYLLLDFSGIKGFEINVLGLKQGQRFLIISGNTGRSDERAVLINLDNEQMEVLKKAVQDNKPVSPVRPGSEMSLSLFQFYSQSLRI